MDYKAIAASVPPRNGSGTQDWVYRVLREGIITGMLKGGTQLKQDEISDALNVSHIPVREALRQLEAQRLVTIHPNRGASVTELSREMLIDMMQVRAAISTAMLKISIPRMTEEDFKALDQNLAEQHSSEDACSFEKLNNVFHELTNRRASNPVADFMTEIIHANIDRYLRSSFYDNADGRTTSMREHEAIVEACKERDVEKAATLLNDHIMNAVSRIPEDLK
ncbi:MAG: GntR family transcriptional regulator [Clostridia bacterium]|nr:GntR family transcriptional regulator [Clostridia bacterium]